MRQNNSLLIKNNIKFLRFRFIEQCHKCWSPLSNINTSEFGYRISTYLIPSDFVITKIYHFKVVYQKKALKQRLGKFK